MFLYCIHEIIKINMQIILAIGNYMNSSKRGGVFGFRLQSLDIVSTWTITMSNYTYYFIRMCTLVE